MKILNDLQMGSLSKLKPSVLNFPPAPKHTMPGLVSEVHIQMCPRISVCWKGLVHSAQLFVEWKMQTPQISDQVSQIILHIVDLIICYLLWDELVSIKPAVYFDFAPLHRRCRHGYKQRHVSWCCGLRGWIVESDSGAQVL